MIEYRRKNMIIILFVLLLILPLILSVSYSTASCPPSTTRFNIIGEVEGIFYFEDEIYYHIKILKIKEVSNPGRESIFSEGSYCRALWYNWSGDICEGGEYISCDLYYSCGYVSVNNINIISKWTYLDEVYSLNTIILFIFNGIISIIIATFVIKKNDDRKINSNSVEDPIGNNKMPMSPQYELKPAHNRYLNVLSFVLLILFIFIYITLITGSIYLTFQGAIYGILFMVTITAIYIFLTVAFNSMRTSPINIYNDMTIILAPKFLRNKFTQETIQHCDIEGIYFFSGHIVFLLRDMKYLKYSLSTFQWNKGNEYRKIIKIYKKNGIKYFTRFEFFEYLGGRTPLK